MEDVVVADGYGLVGGGDAVGFHDAVALLAAEGAGSAGHVEARVGGQPSVQAYPVEARRVEACGTAWWRQVAVTAFINIQKLVVGPADFAAKGNLAPVAPATPWFGDAALVVAQ